MLLWLEGRACKHRGCEASLKHLGWGRVLGRYLGSCFTGFVLLVVLLVRAFWSFFSWFVLFGSFFWGSSFGARACFLFDAFKVLEACVARS